MTEAEPFEDSDLYGKNFRRTMTEAELVATYHHENKAIDDALFSIVAAIDRLTAEVKALREAQETALRLAQGTVFRGEEGAK